MRAKNYFFRLLITLLTFLFSIGIYTVWRNLEANTNTQRINTATPQIELAPSVTETHNSNKLEFVCCRKQLTGNVTINVKRFVSKKGNKCYRYTVKNSANLEVTWIDIGKDKITDLNELVSLPLGWTNAPEDDYERIFVELPNSKSSIEPIATEEQNNIYISTKALRIQPGKTGSFDVCMKSKWDKRYETSHWVAHMYYEGSDITGKLTGLGYK